MVIERGEAISLPSLISALEARYYGRVEFVRGEGEFAIRGGLVDVFSPGARWPIRIELADDTVESLREFDVCTRRTISRLQQTTLKAFRSYSYPGLAECFSTTQKVIEELVASGALRGNGVRVCADSVQRYVDAQRRAATRKVMTLPRLFYTADETGALLAMAPSAVRTAVKAGVLRGAVLSGMWRIEARSIVDFANSKAGAAVAEYPRTGEVERVFCSRPEAASILRMTPEAVGVLVKRNEIAAVQLCKGHLAIVYRSLLDFAARRSSG